MATRYIDFTSTSGTISGTWTFTNGSTSVTGSGGNAQVELDSGDYIRLSDGTQWYKVNGEPPGANTITITPAFQQATHTDDAGATVYNSKDGSSTANAFCHPNQYTTDEVRSAGDIGKMRANQTHVMSGIDINVDEHGVINNRIELRGCDSVDDPWSDGSDVRPIIDFNNTSFKLRLDTNYWKIKNLELKDSTYSNGII